MLFLGLGIGVCGYSFRGCVIAYVDLGSLGRGLGVSGAGGCKL